MRKHTKFWCIPQTQRAFIEYYVSVCFFVDDYKFTHQLAHPIFSLECVCASFFGEGFSPLTMQWNGAHMYKLVNELIFFHAVPNRANVPRYVMLAISCYSFVVNSAQQYYTINGWRFWSTHTLNQPKTNSDSSDCESSGIELFHKYLKRFFEIKFQSSKTKVQWITKESIIRIASISIDIPSHK